MGNAIIGALRVTLGVDTAAFEQGLTLAEKRLNRASKDMRATGESLVSAGAGMSAFVTAPLVALAATSRTAALESRAAIGQVNAALESMGPVAGRTKTQLQDAAAALQGLSTYDDDDILGKVTANMLTFGNVTGQAFDRAQLAAVNLSARLGQDLQSSAIQVGKALNDPIKGVTALSRVGVSFTQQQKDQIAAMVAVGDTAGAQNIILGELEKQYGGAAKAARDANPDAAMIDAWRNFQEVVGDIVLNVLPPLTDMLTSVLNGFNSLDPGTQSFIVGVAAAAAAVGPLLMGIGSIVNIVGAIMPALAPVVALIGEAGLGAALGAAAAAAAPFVAAGAALVAGWMLFGDKIGPVLTMLQEKVQEVLGPKLIGLFNQVKTVLTELWNGPFGEAVRTVIGVLGDLGAAYTAAFGEVVIRLISAFIDIVSGSFEQIRQVIKLVAALLTGDWSSAWNAAKAIVQNAINTVLNVLNSLVPGAGDAVRRMVVAIQTWVVDKLNAIWDGVKRKIDTVKGWFYGLYDAVVGHSYIPDMVDLIGKNIARLDALMVQPVRGMTKAAADSFRQMAKDGSGLIDELFPDEAKIRKLEADLAALDKLHNTPGGIDTAVWAEGRRRITKEITRTREAARAAWGEGEDGSLVTPEMQAQWQKDLQGLATSVDVDLVEPSKTLSLEMIQNFTDMARGVEDSVKGVISSIKKGDFLGALQGVLSVISQIGGILNGGSTGGGLGGLGGSSGGGFGGIITGIASLFGGFRAEGGPVVSGRAYVVGERGPEVFVPKQSGFIDPNNDNGPTGGGAAGGNVTFIFQGPVSNPEQVRRSAAQAGAHLVRMMNTGKRGV